MSSNQQHPETKVKIAASILNADFRNLGTLVNDLESIGVEWLHLDVMDGQFVPPISFGSVVTEGICAKTEMFCDVHLMVRNPENQLHQFANADLISFHLEACDATDTRNDKPNDPKSIIKSIRSLDKKVGIAINPATNPKLLQPFINEVDMVVVMTVNPGWGGQKLIAQQLGVISQVRDMIGNTGKNSHIKIQADGGINLETAKSCVMAGADVLVVGSALVGPSVVDLAARVQELRKLIT